MEEEKWWAGEDRAPTLRPLLVRGQGNEICRKPKGIRKFRETLSHGCTANMICASLRSGGRRLAVRTVMEHPIGALPRTPFASSRRSPQGETRDMREKTASHILHVPFRWFPPLVAGATTFTQREACHWIFGSLCSPTNPVRIVQNVFAVHRFSQGPPIGGQDRDGASYRCSAPYTLSRFAGLPLKGKREI